MTDLFSQHEAMVNALRHTRIMASAGAGKTFQLASRYIRLLVEQADPGRILASTFTRMAAGEIQQKILERLIRAVRSQDGLHALQEELRLPDLTRDQVMEALRLLTRNLHRLHIRTLDSFFAGVATAYGYELGIPPGSGIIEEERAIGLRFEAIRRMMDERDPEQLIELLRRLTQGNSTPMITMRIDREVTELYDIRNQSPPEAWETLPVLEGRLKEPELVEAIERYAACAPKKDNRFIKAHRKDCANARARDWDTFASEGLVAKIADGQTVYYGKPIDPDLVHAAEPLIRHAAAVLVRRWRDENLATREILDGYDTQYRMLKREQGVLTFADLTEAMNRAAELDPLAEMWYRLDAKVDHLLLDEFQDTSVQQWRAMRRVIDEIVSHAPPDRSFFCVGDVKQSIYGWRDAVPEVLERFPELLGRDDETIHTEPLDLSWRSAPAVIRAVNAVFSSLSDNPALDSMPALKAEWGSWFHEHETVKTDLHGYVEMRLMPREEGDRREDREVRRAHEAAQLAADLHVSYPNRSIGILARGNDMVARLLFEVGPAGLDLPCTGRGGGPLIDSPAVVALLDLLRVAEHPDHSVAAFNVAETPLAEALQDVRLIARRDSDRRRLARDIRNRLARDGYARTVGDIVRSITPSVDERQLRRLLHLVALAEQFDRDPLGRPGDFVQLADELSVAESTPAPVQVMNIHQAKGLEFDLVILPELDEPLAKQQASVVIDRDEPTGPIRQVIRRRHEHVRRFVPQVERVFEEHKHREARESLCLLYVAMTRAREGLYILADELGRNWSARMSQVVLGALRPDRSTHRLDEPVYTDQDGPGIVPRSATVAATNDTIAVAAMRPSFARPRVGSRAPRPSSTAHQPYRVLSLSADDRDATDRGTLLHAWFETIEWLDQADIGDDHLHEIARMIMPRRSSSWIDDRADEFRQIIRGDDVRAMLSLGSRDAESWRVHRELPFARIVDDRVQRGTIDRVEIGERPGAPRSATVIDFKSDRVDNRDAPARAEAYRDQLQIYREVIADIFEVDADAIATSLPFLEPGVRIDL